MERSKQVSLGKQTYALVIKTYFVHRKYEDFKRRIHTIVGPDGTQGRYVMLVYRFEEEKHAVSPNKKALMQPSTIKAIKKKLKRGKSSGDVYMEVRQEAGGLSATDVSAKPRTINQIEKLKGRPTQNHSSARKSAKKDQLYSVIVKCVARQLNDVEQFCTNPSVDA